MFLENAKNYLIENEAQDLYFIIHEALEKNKLSFLNILLSISDGEGVTSSENNGFGLDQDWDFPEDFDHVAFFIGGYESSRLSIKEFIDSISFIADKYVLQHPEDKEKVEKYLSKLFLRYKKQYNL